MDIHRSSYCSCAIGIGQTLQKHALNRISALSYLPSARRRRPSHVAATAPSISLISRFKNRTWVLGLLLSYLGEACGNWVALSFVSAAVVTPLGIVAVIVNAVLAQRYLGERVGRGQRVGYAVVTAGVLIILIAAPKGGFVDMDVEKVGSIGDILTECCWTSSFLFGIGGLVSGVAFLVYLIRSARLPGGRRLKGLLGYAGKDADLYLHVCVCSLLGGITVTCGKVLSVIARVRAMSSIEHVVDVTGSVNVGAINGTATETGLGTGDAQQTFMSTIAPVAAILLLIASSILCTEYFRQRAIARFPISRFQPMLYAGLNGW